MARDKWEKMADDVFDAVTEENQEKSARLALGFFAELGRTIELFGADLDRIATALEKRNGD